MVYLVSFSFAFNYPQRVLLIYTFFKAAYQGMTNLASGQGLSERCLPKKYGNDGSKHMGLWIAEIEYGITR